PRAALAQVFDGTLLGNAGLPALAGPNVAWPRQPFYLRPQIAACSPGKRWGTAVAGCAQRVTRGVREYAAAADTLYRCGARRGRGLSARGGRAAAARPGAAGWRGDGDGSPIPVDTRDPAAGSGPSRSSRPAFAAPCDYQCAGLPRPRVSAGQAARGVSHSVHRRLVCVRRLRERRPDAPRAAGAAAQWTLRHRAGRERRARRRHDRGRSEDDRARAPRIARSRGVAVQRERRRRPEPARDVGSPRREPARQVPLPAVSVLSVATAHRPVEFRAAGARNVPGPCAPGADRLDGRRSPADCRSQPCTCSRTTGTRPRAVTRSLPSISLISWHRKGRSPGSVEPWPPAPSRPREPWEWRDSLSLPVEARDRRGVAATRCGVCPPV